MKCRVVVSEAVYVAFSYLTFDTGLVGLLISLLQYIVDEDLVSIAV